MVIIRSGADAQIGSQDTREGWFIDGIHRDPKLYSIKRFCNRVPVLFVIAGTVIDGGRMDVMEDVLATRRIFWGAFFKSLFGMRFGTVS
jgi:hypothetical protein